MALAQRARVVYLHGFRSSPKSFKARLLAERLADAGLASRFVCPQLPPSPAAAVELVLREIAPQPADTLVGSSLGGYYATWLAERCGCRAVLLNPAVAPARDLAGWVGVQRMFHSDDEFVFEPSFLAELASLEVAVPSVPQRYLLIAAKGDELLDWREMVAKYRSVTTVLLEGGDHGLSDFAGLVDRVLAFAGFHDGIRGSKPATEQT
ncbi:MAG TPA: YqiA/YcfP family alpha/beta fold hydrolase [Zeimonas sp.]|nr:YqiA/YcfP family alpha/beta fold hydrolase [Zeimonas sp.]